MEYNRAMSKCMQLCCKSEQCTNDVKEKLQKWEVLPQDIQKILEYLHAERFLNDERFATAFVNDKLKFNHWGRVKISYMLKMKRVSAEIIRTALSEIDEDLYEQILLEEIKKKRPKVKAKTEFERNQKVAAYIVSKGFESDLVFRSLKSDIME